MLDYLIEEMDRIAWEQKKKTEYQPTARKENKKENGLSFKPEGKMKAINKEIEKTNQFL